MKIRSIALVCALLTPVVDARASQVSGDPRIAAVDELFRRMDRLDRPGAAVLVRMNGEVVHRAGYGSANLEYEIPITPDTVFDIASVSKQFGGIAVAMLVEEGRVGMDDDIREHVSIVPDFGDVITVGHLVHHTSGLRDWPGTLAVAGWSMDDVISFAQILKLVSRQEELNFVPGARYSYSNTGYNVLAEMVQSVSGQSFRSWMKTRVFEPLGMRRTHFQDDHTELIERRAWGYRKSGGRYRAIPNGLTALASSSLFTNVDDLSAWIANFESPKVGGAAVIARMEEQGRLNSGEVIDYAFGQSRGSYRGLTTWTHTGSWAGSRTVLTRVPEHRFGVVILSNDGAADPGGYARRIMDIVLEQHLEEAEPDAEPNTEPNTELNGAEDEKQGEKVEVPGELLDRYVGTYKLGPGWLLEVTRHRDALKVQATNEPQFVTVATSQAEFYVPAYRASVRFDDVGTGPSPRVSYREIDAPRVTPLEDGDLGLWEFEGTYRSRELTTEYEIVAEGDRLVARHPRHEPIRLEPLARDEFNGDTWFFGGVEFERDDDGRVTELFVSNGRALRLRFSRL